VILTDLDIGIKETQASFKKTLRKGLPSPILSEFNRCFTIYSLFALRK
jgi:hypothetical protein